jgi:hypothetical protein
MCILGNHSDWFLCCHEKNGLCSESYLGCVHLVLIWLSCKIGLERDMVQLFRTRKACHKQFCLLWLPRAVDLTGILLTDTTPCLHRDSNPRPSGWESDILTILPRRMFFPLCHTTRIWCQPFIWQKEAVMLSSAEFFPQFLCPTSLRLSGSTFEAVILGKRQFYIPWESKSFNSLSSMADESGW